MALVPECLACGVCCFSLLDTYVRVSGDDYERLGDAAERLVRFDGHRAYLRMIDGHCAALGIEANGQYVCGTYETRPDVCRDLARGSRECSGEIETKGGRPLFALEKLLSLFRSRE